MTNYAAWSALPDSIGGLADAYMNAQAMKRQMAMNAVKLGQESAETKKALADSSLAAAREKWYSSRTPGATDVPGMEEAGIPVMQDMAKAPDMGSAAPAPLPGGLNPDVMPAAPPEKTPASEKPLGMSAADFSDLQKKKALQQQKGALGNNSIPRGLATILSKSGFTAAESNRIDALPSAINIHNQIVDAIQAYANNDPSVAKAAIQGYIAKHPTVSGFFQDYKANPNNQAALINALTRLGAIEQFKLQNGSQAMPSQEAILDNQKLLYPTYEEIAARSPVVAQKLNALYDTTISPAVEGVTGRMGYMVDPSTGKIGIPILDTIYGNLQLSKNQLGSKIHGLKGYDMRGGMMQVPASQSGLGQDSRPPLSSFYR